MFSYKLITKFKVFFTNKVCVRGFYEIFEARVNKECNVVVPYIFQHEGPGKISSPASDDVRTAGTALHCESAQLPQIWNFNRNAMQFTR
jgi:hypothetical protein